MFFMLVSLSPATVQKVQALGTAKKLAFHRACENAFSKVVIAVLPSGKVGVQVGRQHVVPFLSYATNCIHTSPRFYETMRSMQTTCTRTSILASCPPVTTTPQELSDPTTHLPTHTP